jgi:cobalt transporter subunit CbtA
MTIVRRLVFAAACAGLLTGLLVTVMHQVGTVPVILRAEVYERAADAGHGNGPAAQPPGVAHDHATHEHEGSGWEPHDGLERTAYTVLADILAAIGYGLLLAAGFALRGREVTWRAGLWWGLAGFAAFTLAPGLGLPPEVPGTEAAPLLGRQVWWVATAALTGSGLALLAYGKQWAWSALAVLLIALPHLWGAPQPAEPGSAAPEALAHQFAVAVTVVSFLSWAVLGSSTAYFYRRFSTA